MTTTTSQHQEQPMGCWHALRRIFAKPFKRNNYKVRKTHSDPLEVEVSHRPRFNSPVSQSQSSRSATAGRSDRFSGGFETNVSSTSSFDGAAYELQYEAAIKRTDFMFYCGSDTPRSDGGDGGGRFSLALSDFSETEEAASDAERVSLVATPKFSRNIPVFFSPRNAVPMMPRPSRERKQKARPMRMASTRAPMFINVNPVRGRGADAL
ncbi:hypothetical protein PybrP1_006216 [[Pythium] brassicae (nom. inval.)]|nr:hypothetical protein PybrP1_006216 [[Pythium] brassicae (nom. inval.)]